MPITPARRPLRGEQRPIPQGYRPGDPLDESQVWTHDEANDDRGALIDHAERLDALAALGLPPHETGFTGAVTYVVDAAGAPTWYHAAPGSSATERGATTPGADPAVWALSPSNSGGAGATDLSAYVTRSELASDTGAVAVNGGNF